MRLDELDTAIETLEQARVAPRDAPAPPHAANGGEHAPDGQVDVALRHLRVARDELARLDGEVRMMRDALAELQSRNRAVFESASDASILVSDTGRIIAANDQAASLFGYEREELVGQAVEILIPERFREVHARKHAASVHAPRERAMGVEFELSARHRDGREFPIEMSLLPHQVRDRTTTVGIIRDVSEKVSAAREIARQRDMLRLVTDSLPALIAYVDHDLHYVFANRPFRKWFGIPPGDTISGTMPDVLGPRVFAQVEPFVERALGREIVSFERTTRHADGSPAILHVTYVPDVEPCTGRCGFFVLVNDVTEHKNAEKVFQDTSIQLGHRVAELEALLDIVPIGVAIADDASCDYVRINREMARMMRMPPGTTASQTGPAGDRPGGFTFMRDGREIPGEELPLHIAARTGEPVMHAQMDAVFDDGTSCSIYTQAVPLFDADGRTRGAIGAFLDITDMRRIEDELRKANAVKDEFLGLMSHELKTPITTILGNAEVLQTRASLLDEADRAAALSDIHDEASRLHGIIDNLLVLARLDRGQRIEREPILVQRVVERAADLHVHRNPHRSVRVRYEGALPPVVASATYVEQVLGNLLSNAEKYSPAHAAIEIEIEIRRPGTHVNVSVCDHGDGIPSEEMDRVFTAFYRSPRTAGFTPGFGIGLAVCKRLIEAQDGQMWVEARPDGGTRFTFALPIGGEDTDGGQL